MIFIPGSPALQQTRHSREIGKQIEHAIRDYQRDNPDVKESDVRAALSQLAAGGDSPEMARRKRAAGIGIAAAAVGAFTALASNGGRFKSGSTTWLFVGAAAAVLAVVFVVIRLTQRN